MEFVWIVVGMSVVTMLPRLLPALLMDRLHFPAWVNRWLQGTPYAALGALIFPGVLSVDPKHPLLGLAGGGIAAVLAYFRLPVLLVICAAILTVMVGKSFN
ncbi:AzlD domain-containing protein [Effusibacillus dendaii]|uniref:Branched-chain amino acid transporter n=1 Tax=Effusibacillus dendaii TaxID=2743772 RepID=A0A7I8DB02_9BACL|nr:AzlD domain-containing protein [Effusibacillus dendaii]BCJ85091.1 branched-chain amino acid transporter [Effusibacillus dendaii]